MTVNAIIAHDLAFGIGKEGHLPWPRDDMDMKWFRENTKGDVVIMGRKTWESLGSKKLPMRTNIVITRSELEGNPDGKYFGEISTLIHMIESEYPDLKIWIIGGADIYKQALPFCDNIYVTVFKNTYECDTFVPMDKYLSNFMEAAKMDFEDKSFSIWI